VVEGDLRWRTAGERRAINFQHVQGVADKSEGFSVG
jgi:hypothetical protein